MGARSRAAAVGRLAARGPPAERLDSSCKYGPDRAQKYSPSRTRCGQLLPPAGVPPHPEGLDGHASHCRACRRKYQLTLGQPKPPHPRAKPQWPPGYSQEEKTCGMCRQVLPVAAFYQQGRGWTWMCRDYNDILRAKRRAAT